ncbi:Hypothetical_protein [Hexamita inflata]|uniref:Hypothetical_protein n=1 Tax=Hexamita inflata TaxID=28002 RepID=A0AA86UTB7_9EUKA|nr:Hypothetical protein HINF_LOCUS58470 [Hexamita inflata]
MFGFISSILWFILGIFGIKKVKQQKDVLEQPSQVSPKLNKCTPTNCVKQTPTNLIREISQAVPNESERIQALQTLVNDLRTNIDKYKIENERLAAINHKLRQEQGHLDRDQGKPV